MADLLENLNERQREAVLETEGYVRVIAGAGSGKTKLLVSRYAYLVQEYGIDSSNILCVTFTNKAAGELKKRIRALIGDHNDTSLICTYHGFCNRLLRENPEKLFLNKQFQIMDSAQQKAILGEIYQKFELKLDYASFESILKKIGGIKRDTSYVTRMCSPKPCPILKEIKDQDDQIIEEFLQRQKATYSLDFHDLISFAIYLLETDADVREKWQNKLNYIMVDEFQDSSAIEMHLVELLSGLFQNLMIVGDPDQNIYEWRGSDVKLLVDFDQKHKPTKTIILNQNYRSTPEILKCANSLIEKNELRLKKDLFTKNIAGATVVHYHSKNDFEEMDRVIENIKRLHKQEGFSYSDFAVIYRSGFLSRVAEKKLVEKNIPYEIFGGVRFYQRMEILDILAYLKLIAYNDDASFRRIINTPRRRFGRAKMNFLEQLRDKKSMQKTKRMQGQLSMESFFESNKGETAELPKSDVFLESEQNQEVFPLLPDAFSEENNAASSISAVSERNADKKSSQPLFAVLSAHLGEKEFLNSDAASFVHFVETMRKQRQTKRISEIVNEVTRDSGYEAYIRELGDEERLDNLAEFKRIANEFEREFGENLSLEEFLQQIALQSGEDTGEVKDTVKLMTIHSSKGLEFPVVFILGFTEGIFPSAKTIGERKKLGLEEERRLCYVAITRAEKYLFLMDSEGVSQNGIKKLASRFLEEIGEQNYIRIGQISDDLKQESKNYTAKLNREFYTDNQTTDVKNTGDFVEHHIFGKGRIEEVDEKRKTYLVRFEGLKQARNISISYFAKEHGNEKQLNRREQKQEQITEKAKLPKKTQADKSDQKENTKIIYENPGKNSNSTDTKTVQEKDWVKIIKERLKKKREKEKDNFTGTKSEQKQDSIEKANGYLWEKRQEEKTDLAETKTEQKQDLIEKTGEYLQEKDEGKTLEIKEGSTAADAAVSKKTLRNNSLSQYFSVPNDAQKENDVDRFHPSKKENNKKKRVPEKSENLWKREDVPKTGWFCTNVADLGAPTGICEMCGYQIIRYVHCMEHRRYRTLFVGCVCAGKMEGNIAGAKKREADFKNRQTRRAKFLKRPWKQSKKGNEYLKIDEHVIVLYHNTNAGNIWKYSINNEFCKTAYATREKAVAAVFDALELIRTKG